MPQCLDVVIVGGGPAGCIVAMLLARHGCSVTVLDKGNGRRVRIGETLPPQASRLFARLGFFEAFRGQGHRTSAGIISVWGGVEPIVNDFLFSPHGSGWHIDRRKFESMLTEAAISAGAMFFRHTRVEECVKDEEGWVVRAWQNDFPCPLKCRVLVDASGRSRGGKSRFPRRVVVDRLIGVAGLSAPRRGNSPSDFTLVEAVDEGWFYSALLPCGDYILAYMTDADLYSAGHQRFRSFFESQMDKAHYTRDRIDCVPSDLTVVSAVGSVREAVAESRWLAVGDAARSYDPLSGLGLYTAIDMGMRAVPVILDMLEGLTESAIDYGRANDAAFAEYRKAHLNYYSQEHRWPDSEFWLRRRKSE